MDQKEPILKVPIGIRIAEARGEHAVKRLYILSLIRLAIRLGAIMALVGALVMEWISVRSVENLAALLSSF